MRDPAMEKQQSLSEVIVRGTVNMSILEERAEHTGLFGCNVLFQYGKEPNFTALRQNDAVLNSICLRKSITSGGNVIDRSSVRDDWHYKLHGWRYSKHAAVCQDFVHYFQVTASCSSQS